MKFLNRIWPWRRFEQDAQEILNLRVKINNLEWALKAEQAHHCLTKEKHHETHRELTQHRETVEANKGHFKKLAVILAVKAGLSIVIFFCCLTGFAQGPARNVVTTNRLGAPLSTLYFLGWDGSKPAWFIPPDGLGTNYWTTNTSFIFPLQQLRNSNNLGFFNLAGDISINSTNQATVVSNGVLAHTITMAGTATGLSFSPSGAQTLSSDPSFTGKILPSAIVTNLFNSGDQYKTNGSISSTAYDIMASNNLGSFSASSGLGNFTATSGAAFKTPTNTPAVGQQINVTSTAGDTAYQNPHYLSTITGGQYVWTGVASSAARYCPIWGFQNAATTATEASASAIFTAGYYTNLYVRLVGLGNQTNMTFTIMVGNSATALTVSINGNGSTLTAVDTTHSAVVTDQGVVDFRFVANCPTAPANTVLAYWTVQFAQ